MREGNKMVTEVHNETFKRVMDNLQGAKFYLNRIGHVEIIDAYGKK